MSISSFEDYFDRTSFPVGNGWIETEGSSTNIVVDEGLKFYEDGEVTQTEEMSNRLFLEMEFEVDLSYTNQAYITWIRFFFAEGDSFNRMGFIIVPNNQVLLVANRGGVKAKVLLSIDDWSIGYELVRIKVQEIKQKFYFFMWNGTCWIKSAYSYSIENFDDYNFDYNKFSIKHTTTASSGISVIVNYFKIRQLSPNMAMVDQ